MKKKEMSELAPAPLARPMDHTLAGAEIAGLNSLVAMLNNPEITGAEVPKGLLEQSELEPGFPTPATVVVKPKKISGPSRLFFTGKLCVGKDHIAKATGAELFGFADPIYEIASKLTGLEIASSKGKDLPGVRALLQAIGLWGRNEISPQYPITPARILFVKMVRDTGGFPEFGINEYIWVENLLARWHAWVIRNPFTRAAVTNVRFTNEFKSLSGAGWIHWHVMCSPATWTKRLEAASLSPRSPSVLDSSEQLAASLDADVIKQISAQKTGPMLRCIWNDEEVKPPSMRLHTLSSFLQTLALSEIPSGVDFHSNILTGE